MEIRGRSRVKRAYSGVIPARMRWLIRAGATVERWDATVRRIRAAAELDPSSRTKAQRVLLLEPSSADGGAWWSCATLVLYDLMEIVAGKPVYVDPKLIPDPDGDLWWQIEHRAGAQLSRHGIIETGPAIIQYADLLASGQNQDVVEFPV